MGTEDDLLLDGNGLFSVANALRLLYARRVSTLPHPGRRASLVSRSGVTTTRLWNCSS
jgi:hypothetical protein